MKPLALVADPVFDSHDTGPGHPERPARMAAVRAGLEESAVLTRTVRIAPTPVSEEDMLRVHTADYLRRVKATCDAGRATIDESDCAICPGSFDIARLAAGAIVAAAERVASGGSDRGFCAVRPPGHHAERDRAMGFCLLANVAIAAEALRARCGLKRIAILDWDVHHGNGTQHIFEADPDVLFVSLHGDPTELYPGTGFVHETGVGAGVGATVNIPLPAGTRDDAWRAAFERSAVPAIDAFKPEMLIVSCGFDAHADDPIGNLKLSDETYGWMLRHALELAACHSAGRLLSVLEGGYNLDVLRRCTAQHVRILANV